MIRRQSVDSKNFGKYKAAMPMQVVFPITMVGVGVGAASALVVVANHMIYKKVGYSQFDLIFIGSQTRDGR